GVPENAPGAPRSHTGDAQPRVGILGHRVGRSLESLPKRRGFRTVGTVEQLAAVARERRELRTQRAQLVVVAAHIVDDADRRAVADERPVRFARLGHGRTLRRTSDEATAGALANE